MLNAQRPLQLRAEGLLRRLVTDRNADGASAAFRALEEAVASAADGLAGDLTIAATVDAVLQAGGLARHLSDTSPAATAVRFRPEDGSLFALLRAVQPAIELDEAGLLTLLASGTRTHHVLLQPTDRKAVAVRRLLHAQLLPALTAPTVAIVEGPHDLTTYTSADRHRAVTALPLAAAGVRLISADNGSGGGTGQIPRVAELARAMGFRVIALIDSDPVKTSAMILTQIEATCDAVVRLPADRDRAGADDRC